MIVRTGEDSPQERYWQDAAASITTGMILHVCYEAAARRPRRLSRAILPTCSRGPGPSFRDTLTNCSTSSTIRDTSTTGGCPTGEHDGHASGRARESAGDARQGGQGLRRRPFHGENGADALQRSAGSEEHLGERFHHRRSGEPRAARFAVPCGSAFGQDPPAPSDPADVHDDRQPPHRKDGLRGRRAEAQQTSPAAS